MAGFNLTPDSEILGYAAIYGMLYALSMTCIFTAYKHINMIVYSVFGKSSAIIVCIIGIAFLGDTPSATTIISVGIRQRCGLRPKRVMSVISRV